MDHFWFESYLSDRTQSVRLAHQLSDILNVNYGAPPGPILFSIYVNDLAETINVCCLVQYADDTQFIHVDAVNNLNDLISNTEGTLLNVKRYFLRNGLLLNPKKKQCIFIGNRQLLTQIPPATIINCDSDVITPITHAKNLGVYFDRYMFFDRHIF